jgi:hypothetical protein
MAVECEWRFKEARSVLFGAMWGRQSKTLEPTKASGEGGVEEHRQIERGWRIHHYFEEGVDEYTIEARFFHLGEPVTIDGQSGSEPVVYTRVVRLESPANAGKVWREKWIWGPAPQALQLVAALLVPLATLAITTAGEGTSGRWWDLLTLGFGSETIRNILTGREGQGQKSG